LGGGESGVSAALSFASGTNSVRVSGEMIVALISGGAGRAIRTTVEEVSSDCSGWHTSSVKDGPLNWGGTTQLCTRESKFEINEHGDCGSRGLAPIGFAAIDMSSGGKTLRFAMP